MEVHSDWYNRIAKEISSRKDALSRSEYKKYKLDLLLRLAKRVDSFSSICGECQMSQQEIKSLTEDLGNLPMMSKEGRKSYFSTINNMVKHMQKHHKLINEGQNFGIWMAIGTGVGVAIGAGSDNVGAGMPIGLAIGIVIGGLMDAKAKREGKVI